MARATHHWVALALAGAALAPWARAGDGPFLHTTTAVVEDDDERVFEFSTTLVNQRHQRGWRTQLGYSFSPTLSAELELGREWEKGATGSERELGVGLWQAWLDPAREGWGLASSIELEWARATGSPWQRPALNAVLAASLPLLDHTLWLHANLGARNAPGDEHRRWDGLWSVAAQYKLARRTETFIETGGTTRGSERSTQLGLRQWLVREKIAADIGIGRRLADGERHRFVAMRLSFFDISP
ncbi:hypothetical protein [Hydrogenophaga sp. OTU3427]|uniref:hypothetical protein n=1 Tax=Hydrogenophaga sp. OTU3427 TaxID=3043856 RepID=UPI00313F33E9